MWTIDVHAGPYFIELASQLYGNDLSLYYLDDPETGLSYRATSPHLNDVSDSEEVGKRIYSLQVILNGALLASEVETFSRPVEFARFWREGHQIFKAKADQLDEFPFSDSVSTTEEDPFGSAANDVGRLIHLSKQSDPIRINLLLLGLISKRTTIEKIHSWNQHSVQVRGGFA